jgi:iron(III) transport system ATP-binding protein
MNTAAPILVLDGVSQHYGSRTVLDGVSLEVAAGELVCLLGPSGSGKSTALRIAAGIEVPAAGRVLLEGRVVSTPGAMVPPEDRRLGFMSQDFALFPHLTVLDNVAFGLDALGAAERRARALGMLESVGMAGFAAAWPHQISGGQQQRVALARALARGPKVMLLDEPFSGLDRALRDQIWEDTVSILRLSSVATLMVTHDAEEAMVMADCIAVLREGRIVQTGRPEALYDHPADPFVATLFGPVNAFQGIVQGGRIGTPIGSFVATGVAEGSPGLVLVRPEALRPRSAPDGPARVEEVRLRGAYLSVRLALDGASPGGAALLARTSRALEPAPGQRMALSVDPAGVFVFKADQDM